MARVDTAILADVRAIKARIQAFFDAINAADPEALGSHFFPAANMTIIRQTPPRDPTATVDTTALREEKLTVMTRTTIEHFIKLISDDQKKRKGQPPGPVLHEWPELDTTEIKFDALFAVAWSPFKVTFDGVLHHYGTMVFTMGKSESEAGEWEWKIENLTQSYRRAPGWD